MLHITKQFNFSNLLANLERICPSLLLLMIASSGYTQTITKTNPPSVQTPATVGRIVKFAGVANNGAGIIGDSVITETAGNILISGNATANTVNATTLNVSGNATVGGALSGNIVNSATQYNIGGFHVLSSNAGSFNLFAGFGAGQNTSGSADSFFGFEAGRDNVSGSSNAFFGFRAGTANIDGNANSFFGRSAGEKNTTGDQNSFFGEFAGQNNTTGSGNNLFGEEAGSGITTGTGNNFFGVETGEGTTTGRDNSFFGDNAGNGNVTGSSNTLIGATTGVLGANLNHATAIGAGAQVAFSNFIVIGRILGEDTVQVPGDLIVGGSVSKGSGSFKIDYPLDPANKTLSHSFVESPDMMNVYNGNITTDAKGEALVVLPEYFEALNREFRYQLTVIGQFAQAIVAREIKDNSFSVKTDKPNVKVSWQVTGIRNDAFANAHRITVVEDKGNQRGTYLHPQLFSSAVHSGKKLSHD